MPASYNFVDAQRLLLKPFERLRFVIIFVLTTSLSRLVAEFVCSQPAFYPLWERSQIQFGIANGVILGMFIGVSQWFILRKYISDWKWILVVGVSITFIVSIKSALDMRVESLLASNDGLFGQILAVSFLSSMGASFIFGYLQWFVLSSHVTSSRWWIFIPFIAQLIIVLTRGIQILQILLGIYVPGFLQFNFLRFNMDVVHLTILPATQAIGFCFLKKRSVNQHNMLQSPLALVNDVVNYWEIKRLEKILYKSIERMWRTDLRTSIGQLKYLVGINRNGNMIAYEPMNQSAADNVDQTPLPALASLPSCAALEAESQTGLAKFQVMFTPPGMLQINSWRGIPLIWLGVGVYAGIIGISVLSAWLPVYFFSFRT